MQEEVAGVCEARVMAVDLRRNHSKGLGTWSGLGKELGHGKRPPDEK